ncbi:MAG: heparan-alpha-glucosaminide N-acetyltransferase domain-containing protein, partial [Rhodospirillales bacterium]|nr:heparan-alpha-glucosaminide N-acetyltransferase domain-containing protein [Rhodospirillales bacterium]
MINPETAPRTRFASIDMMRGAAILLMFIYHFSWDLTFFGYASFDL